MTTLLENVGSSDMIRELVSKTDTYGTTISLILDIPRTLEVTSKLKNNTELTVQCHDDDVTVILHLPYAPGAVGRAYIVHYTTEEE